MSSYAKRIDLNSGWEFRRGGDSVWYPATVPGSVHTDLFINHLIPDPFLGNNEKQLQWIENEDWEYRKTFYADDSVTSELYKSHVYICFDGVDTYADIYLNDKLVIQANNMFRNWQYDVQQELKTGENSLRIFFKSPIKFISNFKNMQELPGGKQVYTRKSPYMYGWDWGPRYVTSGIWKDVYLEYDEIKYSYSVQSIKKDSAVIILNSSFNICLLYTSPSPRDRQKSRMPSSA